MNLYIKNITEDNTYLVKKDINIEDKYSIYDVSNLFQGVIIKIKSKENVEKIKVFCRYNSTNTKLEFVLK